MELYAGTSRWNGRLRIIYLVGRSHKYVLLEILLSRHVNGIFPEQYLDHLHHVSYSLCARAHYDSVGAMMSAPTEQAGVVGAILQTAVQAGNAIGLSIQSGLLTIHPGGVDDFRNVAASFYFIIAWGGAWLLLFWCFYRPTKASSRPMAVH